MKVEIDKEGGVSIATVMPTNENSAPVNTGTPISPTGDTQITLPSGRKAVQRSFKGRDIRLAQRLADGESSTLIFAIISTVTTIDGKPVTIEELDDMDGFDCMELMKGFGTNFTSRPNS